MQDQKVLVGSGVERKSLNVGGLEPKSHRSELLQRPSQQMFFGLATEKSRPHPKHTKNLVCPLSLHGSRKELPTVPLVACSLLEPQQKEKKNNGLGHPEFLKTPHAPPPPPRMVTCELSRVCCWLGRRQQQISTCRPQGEEKSLSRAENGPRRLSQKVEKK